MENNGDMPAPQEKSADGVNVFLDSYHIQDTYAGCLEGLPDVKSSLAHATRRLEHVWGMHRPVLVVQPVLQDGPPTYDGGKKLQRLPSRCMMAWLNSYSSPPGEEWCGSHLFVIWFDEDDAQNPLLVALKHVNEAGGWWANAKGWDP